MAITEIGIVVDDGPLPPLPQAATKSNISGVAYLHFTGHLLGDWPVLLVSRQHYLTSCNQILNSSGDVPEQVANPSLTQLLALFT
jgi:hypothetical protein